jgi:CheY-like chemotaxis protein
VLLADDSTHAQRIGSKILTSEGIEVITVSNGEAAVKKLAAGAFDLVLADVFMPGRTGYELCSFIKSSPNLAHIPVVLMVGLLEPYDSDQGKHVGAETVIRKPFEPSIMLETVKQLLEAAKQRRPAAPPIPAPAVRAKAEQPAPPPVEEAPAPEMEAPVASRPEPVEVPPDMQGMSYGAIEVPQFELETFAAPGAGPPAEAPVSVEVPEVPGAEAQLEAPAPQAMEFELPAAAMESFEVPEIAAAPEAVVEAPSAEAVEIPAPTEPAPPAPEQVAAGLIVPEAPPPGIEAAGGAYDLSAEMETMAATAAASVAPAAELAAQPETVAPPAAEPAPEAPPVVRWVAEPEPPTPEDLRVFAPAAEAAAAPVIEIEEPAPAAPPAAAVEEAAVAESVIVTEEAVVAESAAVIEEPPAAAAEPVVEVAAAPEAAEPAAPAAEAPEWAELLKRAEEGPPPAPPAQPGVTAAPVEAEAPPAAALTADALRAGLEAGLNKVLPGMTAVPGLVDNIMKEILGRLGGSLR